MSQPATASAAQFAANRANAQRSTGPTSPEGKATSSLNALKMGLTGRTVLLPNEDANTYQARLDTALASFQPATGDELALVQSIVDCHWRLDRIQRFESVILLKGCLELAKLYEDHAPLERARLIEAEAYIKYEKQLRNLNIQEARLRRLLDKEKAELAKLQAERRTQEQADVEAVSNDKPAVPTSELASNLQTTANPQPIHQPADPTGHSQAAASGGDS